MSNACDAGSAGEQWGVYGTDLFGGEILDGADETTYLVAHGLGGDAGGGCLEVDVTASANAGIEGIDARCERGHRAGGGCEDGKLGESKGRTVYEWVVLYLWRVFEGQKRCFLVCGDA